MLLKILITFPDVDTDQNMIKREFLNLLMIMFKDMDKDNNDKVSAFDFNYDND